MPHEVAPLPFKPTLLNGLSERLLASHYENNYGGAVRRLNAIEGELAQIVGLRSRVRCQWPQARGIDCRELDDPPRGVLRQPRRLWRCSGNPGRRPGAGLRLD